MHKRMTATVFCFFLCCSGYSQATGAQGPNHASNAAQAAEHTLKVAADGSGVFRTIQAAVDSIPEENRERIIISIKNGTYREQVRIHKSFLTLRGEERKQTRIVAEIDTSACPTAPGESKEEKCATILADGENLVFENFTVQNAFQGPGHGKGAALSIAGNATRIVISNVNVVGYGGDTLTLSARRSRIGDGGEYYLNNVFVSGTYHIIVPRGATYATHCKFWCMGGEKNCLFNEGVTRETDKLVIRNSVIDGLVPFGLGSYFRDAAWYFVEDRISNKLMPEGRIYREPARNYEMKWGEGRIYFAGNRAPDYPWLKDNLAQSPAKAKAVVTAAWTFPEWNPESAAGPVVRRLEIGKGSVRVIFSESVTVNGQPRLKLASGGKADYVSGSGSEVLMFRTQSTGDVQSVELNGSSIFASAASLHRRDADLSLDHADRKTE